MVENSLKLPRGPILEETGQGRGSWTECGWKQEKLAICYRGKDTEKVIFQEGKPGWGTQVGWAGKVLNQGNHQKATGGVRWYGPYQTGAERTDRKWRMGEAVCEKNGMALVND